MINKLSKILQAIDIEQVCFAIHGNHACGLIHCEDCPFNSDENMDKLIKELTDLSQPQPTDALWHMFGNPVQDLTEIIDKTKESE